MTDGTLARLGKNEGVRKMKTAERKAVIGSPDLGGLTTSHIERAFPSLRQELKRYQRKGLGYSKDLDTHKAAVALHFGIYNFVRIHKTLGTTPAVAAGVEYERWSLERAVEMMAEYIRRKEDAEFVSLGHGCICAFRKEQKPCDIAAWTHTPSGRAIPKMDTNLKASGSRTKGKCTVTRRMRSAMLNGTAA